MTDFWPTPKQRMNRLLEGQYRQNPHQGYDEIMLDPRVPKDDTPWWLQNTLNMPANALGILSNAVADTANTGRAFLDPSVAPDPSRPTASGDQQLAEAGLLGVGSAGLAAAPAAAMARGGGQALGALASQNRQASPFAMLPAAEPRSSVPKMFEAQRMQKMDEVPFREFETYHGTTPRGAAGIATDGFRLPSQAGDDYLGQGIYTTPDKARAEQYADADVRGGKAGPVIATINRGRYLVIDESLLADYGGGRGYDDMMRMISEAKAAGLDGVQRVSANGSSELMTFPERGGTIFDRASGRQLYSTPVSGILATEQE